MQLQTKWLGIASVALLAVVVIFASANVLGGNEPPDDITVTPVGEPTPTPDGATPEPEPEPTPATTPTPPPGDHIQAVVTAHDLATEAGLEMLERGGTAADAAIAVATVLTVVEPWFSSALGGGTWALYYDATNDEVTSMGGVGRVGSRVTVDDYTARAGNAGMHQANTPGAWDGWMRWLDLYGELDLGEILQPAIDVAREGYTIDQTYAEAIAENNIFGRPSTATSDIYAPDGSPLGQGDVVYQHDMADTFEALAGAYESQRDAGRSEAVQAARDYFYRGPIAEAIVEFSDAHGGYLTLEDFAAVEAEIVEPISIDWNDELMVYQSPPNSQGITMLLALNVLKDYDFAGTEPDSADAVHLAVEAAKLAFSDRYHHVGDPARVDVPVEALLSDQHAERQRGRIDMNNAMSWPIPDGLEPIDEQAAHTTTFHVVDRWGNGAAVTTSLGNQLFVVGDTGIHINNRMRFYSVEDGHPNQVESGYKVRHTSNPYMAFRNGRPYILGGNTGADIQSQAQAQQFINIAEFGMSAQEAVDRWRWVTMAFPATTYPWVAANILRVESGAPPGLIEELRARGHHAEEWFGSVGNASVIVLDPENGDAEIGAEPRNRTSTGVVVEPEP